MVVLFDIELCSKENWRVGHLTVLYSLLRSCKRIKLTSTEFQDILLNIVLHLTSFNSGYFSAFLIPSDFDDTFLNIGLGALLKNTRVSFPTLYNIWVKNNTHYETAFRDLKKYAYRPMNIDLDANAIDTRTYYYLRGFLEEAKKNGQTVSLVTTWVSIEDRPDLALTYYPSRYSFYYYVARTLFILETQYVSEGTLPMEILNQTRTKFKRVLQGKASEMILSEANPDGDGLYFEEFLGNGDTDFSGAPMKRGEDRLFSTSMAINFYIATWAVQDKTTGKLYWTEGTPNDIKEVVEKAVKWLNTYILEDTYKPFGAFFSGSFKGAESVPFYFPTNHIEFLNGTILPSNTSIFDRNIVIAMSGVIGEEEYEDLLKITHFGKMTPTNFTGYNDPNAVFPFWTSDAYTYANTLLALAKFQNLNS
ncbi:uncharacterized protein LOC117103538 [Anneissia japonica]|uniref:uncharacterized protein LOC117103538 n=1 Tax=Anneissia japonica TaxID=1529436 RepID=UPI001425B4F5|nr:uncharacterized protein LOC117103538 [Anneissia japonica]